MWRHSKVGVARCPEWQVETEALYVEQEAAVGVGQIEEEKHQTHPVSVNPGGDRLGEGRARVAP